MERKKAVYRPTVSTYGRRTVEKLPEKESETVQKLKKIEPKQRVKLDAKTSSLDVTSTFVTPMKPARNTGFNPDSIVIEGGFKPIIRNIDSDSVQRRISEKAEREEDARVQEATNHRPIDNFEPVFIPSPPVPTVDTVKKSKKKVARTRATEADDMEMAADRANAYYLPPSAISKDQPSSEVLITYDGKRLKDSGLARSISGIEEHSKAKLSSDMLSKTPQFGRFKGELPPPIPGEVRSDYSRHENTKLTLVERSKRSPHEGHVHVTNSRANSTVDHHDHRDHRGNTTSMLVSAGQAVISNLGYILLTVVFYHVI